MNEDIKKYIREAGFKQWEIAGFLGHSEGKFIKLMRYKIPLALREKIFNTITVMANKRGINNE